MFPFLGSLPQTTNLVVCISGGGEVNYQMQIVTKLPNENIQNYQLQMIDSRGRGVNYQMQIVTKLPNGTTEVAQNDSEQPILPNLQFFQSFPTEVAQNDSEWPILPDLQLFQSFPTEVV